jgi:hypothetical protein
MRELFWIWYAITCSGCVAAGIWIGSLICAQVCP